MRFLFFLVFIAFAPTRGAPNIHTFTEVSEQVSGNPSFIAFSGTGHVLGGTTLPPEAIAEARVARFGGGESLVSQGLSRITDVASHNVHTAQVTMDATLGHCLRSGSGCTGSLQALAHDAAEVALDSAKNTATNVDSVVTMTNMIPGNMIGVAVGAYTSVKTGQKEAEDICDDEGIGAYAPIAAATGGQFAVHAVSGSAFASCLTGTTTSVTSSAAPLLGPYAPVVGTVSGVIAGIGCSLSTSHIGNQITQSIVNDVHGRRRAYLHQTEVRRVFKDLMNIGSPDDELRMWFNQAITAANSRGLLDLKNAGVFWSAMPDEFISDMLDFATDDIRDQAEAYVDYAKTREGDNKFMPSSAQVSYLKKHILSKWCLPSNWDEWIDLWKTGSALYTGFKSAVKTDQKKRAVAIADMLDAQNLIGERFTVTMMDGHGRQWLATLLELQSRGYDLEKVHLRIVDIDDAVNDWHELFFPSSYTTVIRSTPDEGGIYKEDVPEKGILYMNFCGLGGTNAILESRIKEFQEAGVLSKTIVSISSRGGDNPDTYDFLTGLGTEVCSRGSKGMGFHTFTFQ